MSANMQPSALPSQELQQSLYSTLLNTLSPDSPTRSTAETSLPSVLDPSNSPYTSLALCNILFFAPATPQDIAIRQSAAIMLQKLIQAHWSPIHSQFAGEDKIVPEEVKNEVRNMLLMGLNVKERKLRTACAFAISTIAQSDYPADFPQLLPTLMHYLQAGVASSSQDEGDKTRIAVHGAMRVLSEFVRQELAENEMIGMMREIGPVLLEILRSPSSDPGARVSTIQIFRNCVRTLYIIKDEHPDAANTAVATMLPMWLETLRGVLGTYTGEGTVKALQQEDEKAWAGLGILAELFRTFSTVQSCFPRVMTTQLEEYITLSTLQLQTLYPIFYDFYVSSTDSAREPPSASSNADDDLESDVPAVACAALDFLTAISRARGAKNVFIQADGQGTKLHQSLVALVLKWSQIRRDEEDDWLSDPNAFVADDDDESESYGLRTSGFDLLGSLLDKFAGDAGRVLQQATKSRMQEADEARSAGQSDWWKALEGCLAAVGAVADSLLDMLDEEKDSGIVESFDLDNLFKNVLPQLLNMTDLPFLQGRAFVFASQFVLALESGGMAGQYLDAAIQALETPDVGLPVKISSIKTIRNFCRYMPADQLSTRSLKIIAQLVPFLEQATEESLTLVMEAIRAVIGVDSSVLTPDITRDLVVIILRVWLKNAEDPLFTSIVEDSFETIAGSASAYDSLVQHAVPVLAEIIAAPVDEENMSLPATALELIEAILRGRRGPLGNSFGPLLWPSLFSALATTEDSDTIQHGCSTLTLFVRKDCEQLLTCHLGNETGLQKILGLLAQLLQPESNESSGLFVGDLILHLLRNAGQHLNAVLPDLLRALVNRIASASSGLFIQTLALPFAYLFYVAKDITLDLLSQIEVNGQNGLDVVLRGWCDEAVATVQGSYSIRINNLAMINLFPVERLQRVIVKGDQIIDDSNRNTIMTRSRTKSQPETYAQIPFSVRALKYLLSEVQNAEIRAEENGKFGGDEVGIEDDDGDDDWENDDPLDVNGGGKDEMAFLSDLMGGGGGAMKGWMDDTVGAAEDEDEDLMNDPIVQMDIHQTIVDCLRQAYAQNTNNIHEMVPLLNDVEKTVMQKVLTL